MNLEWNPGLANEPRKLFQVMPNCSFTLKRGLLAHNCFSPFFKKKKKRREQNNYLVADMPFVSTYSIYSTKKGGNVDNLTGHDPINLEA